jgi:hypothetical protein
MSKTFSEKIGEHFDVSFSSIFCFIAFSGASQRWEFKNATKNFLQKIASKTLTKESTKSKTDWLSIKKTFFGFGFCYMCARACRVRRGPGRWAPSRAAGCPARMADGRQQGADSLLPIGGSQARGAGGRWWLVKQLPYLDKGFTNPAKEAPEPAGTRSPASALRTLCRN